MRRSDSRGPPPAPCDWPDPSRAGGRRRPDPSVTPRLAGDSCRDALAGSTERRVPWPALANARPARVRERCSPGPAWESQRLGARDQPAARCARSDLAVRPAGHLSRPRPWRDQCPLRRGPRWLTLRVVDEPLRGARRDAGRPASARPRGRPTRCAKQAVDVVPAEAGLRGVPGGARRSTAKCRQSAESERGRCGASRSEATRRAVRRLVLPPLPANSCCTRSCAYAVGVARSRTLLGRWRRPGIRSCAAAGGWRCPRPRAHSPTTRPADWPRCFTPTAREEGAG